MKVGRAFALAAVCLAASACFHQVVQTGRTPGTTVIQKPWTATWLWGLVPATPIDVTQQCRTGVATVVTEMSFPNGLASFVTLGIYSPRAVTVTCATGSALRPGMQEFFVGRTASPSERDAVFSAAIAASDRTHQPVVIRF